MARKKRQDDDIEDVDTSSDEDMTPEDADMDDSEGSTNYTMGVIQVGDGDEDDEEFAEDLDEYEEMDEDDEDDEEGGKLKARKKLYQQGRDTEDGFSSKGDDFLSNAEFDPEEWPYD